MAEPTTYTQALAKPSRGVWSGCGDGRCRPCGRVHDFGRRPSYGDYIHRFKCAQNHTSGCPQPKPEPEHSWSGNRCTVCGRAAQWVAPDGAKYRTLQAAAFRGFKRRDLKRESEAL